MNAANPSASCFALGEAAQEKGNEEVKRILVLMLQSMGKVLDEGWGVALGSKLASVHGWEEYAGVLDGSSARHALWGGKMYIALCPAQGN